MTPRKAGVEQRHERRRADADPAGVPKEMTTSDVETIFVKGIHRDVRRLAFGDEFAEIEK
jgi:hypothetical protein